MIRRFGFAAGTCGGIVLASSIALGQAATAPADAVGLYTLAAGKCVVDCPSSGVEDYPNHPPFGAAWEAVEKAAWEKNAEARGIARRTRTVDVAVWPADEPSTEMRRVTHELTDAALYEHIRGNDAEAIEFVLDAWHIAEIQRRGIAGAARSWGVVRAYGAGSNETLVTEALMTMAPGLRIGGGKGDGQTVSADQARKIIGWLVACETAERTMEQAMGEDWRAKMKKMGDEAKPVMGIQMTGERLIAKTLMSLRQPVAERGMAAMSLAAQLFQREKGRWPTDAGELVPGYLPALPIDPFGDGKETLGYALVKGGLPGGGDRPLVYSREELDGVPFYRLEGPQYGFYYGYQSRLLSSEMRHGGQFRDLARWDGVKLEEGAATTRPVEVSR